MELIVLLILVIVGIYVFAAFNLWKGYENLL
jgi:hypothetical protein